MKFEGEVKFKKITPQGMQFVGVVEGFPLPLPIFIPNIKGLQREGKITIEIPKVVEVPQVEKPKKKKG